MDYDMLMDYCLSKPGAKETYPFDEISAVIKVGGKMFALFSDRKSDVVWLNLKCDPDTSLILRSQYKSVEPGYHMNKDHWNTIRIDGSIPDDQIFMMIDMSYDLVFNKLPRSVRSEILEEN